MLTFLGTDANGSNTYILNHTNGRTYYVRNSFYNDNVDGSWFVHYKDNYGHKTTLFTLSNFAQEIITTVKNGHDAAVLEHERTTVRR